MKYDTVKLDRENFAGYRLEIKGLKGGHSGMEIILQRANANKLFARFMRNCQEKLGIMLCDIDGGGLRNAIPREAFATVAVMKNTRKPSRMPSRSLKRYTSTNTRASRTAFPSRPFLSRLPPKPSISSTRPIWWMPYSAARTE